MLGFLNSFTEHMACPGEMDFQNLTDVHSGRYAQRIQYQINRTSIRSEWHIFHRKDSGAYALVTVTACHLIAFTNLTFLCNVYAYELVDAWCHFIAVFTGKHLNVHYLTEFAMWNTEGGITYFSFLVAENSAEESFFRCQFGFALRGNLTYQNVSRTYISTDADNTVFIKVLDSFFAYGRRCV